MFCIGFYAVGSIWYNRIRLDNIWCFFLIKCIRMDCQLVEGNGNRLKINYKSWGRYRSALQPFILSLLDLYDMKKNTGDAGFFAHDNGLVCSPWSLFSPDMENFTQSLVCLLPERKMIHVKILYHAKIYGQRYKICNTLKLSSAVYSYERLLGPNWHQSTTCNICTLYNYAFVHQFTIVPIYVKI